MTEEPRRAYWNVGFNRWWWLGLVLSPLLGWSVLSTNSRWLLALGVNHVGGWFLDLFAILASNDALKLGLNVYAPNPLDPVARPHVYSHWWLRLGKLGLTRADNFWLGLVLGVAFFAVVVCWLRPRGFREMVWYLAVLISSPVFLAFERANNDLVIFLVLAPVVPCLLSTGVIWQGLACLLLALATGLKFYPTVAALILFLPGERHDVRLRWMLGGLLVALSVLDVAPDFMRVRPLLPAADGLMTFGAINLFTRFGAGASAAKLLSLGLGVGAIGLWSRAKIFDGWEIPPAVRGLWLHFVLGAALLCGCFFAGTNYAYRWIFALWLAPWLWWMWNDAGIPRGVRRLAGVTMILLGAALWIDPLTGLVLVNLLRRVPSDSVGRGAEWVFAAEQPVTWALFVCLLGFLTYFIRDGLRRARGAR